MATWKTWVLRLLGAIAALLLIAAGVTYALSARAIGRKYPVREVALTIPTDSAGLARGAHLVDLSCRGCHTPSLHGAVLFSAPGVATIYAPNVLQRITKYSNAQLAGYLRYGIKRDGSASFVMPPKGYYHLSDADLASIVGYLRSLPPSTTDTLPANSYGPLGRMGVMLGQFALAVSSIDTTAPRLGNDSTYRTTRQGEYYVRVICTECHGVNLAGDPSFPAPAIAGGLGYSAQEFATLLSTGTPRDPAKTLTTMGEAARLLFTHFTPDEVTAIHTYLTSLPVTGIPGVK